MFKFVTLAFFAFAVQSSLAYPQDAAAKPPVAIVSQTSVIDGTGTFNFAYETADGIKEEGTGSLKSIKVPKLDESGQKVGEEDGQGIVQSGKYSYTAPNGELIEVSYIADENGFQPTGAHIPKP